MPVRVTSLLALLGAAMVLFALFPRAGPARAANLAVTDTADEVDASPGDGVCATAAGTCTLRAAIQEANALPGRDTITLQPGAYTLAAAGLDEDAAASGDLDIRADLTIVGAGATATVVDGNRTDRVFEVFAPADVSISGLAIQNGDPGGGLAGGGIRNGGALALDGVEVRGNDRFGVVNGGSLTIANSAISGNPSRGIENGRGGTLALTNVTISGNGGGGLSSFGPATLTDVRIIGNTRFSGIDNNGPLTLTGGTISDNTPGIGGRGGGVSNATSATLTLEAVTVSGNRSSPDGGGGGILNFGTLTLEDVTLSGNSAASDGGGIRHGGTLVGDSLAGGILTVNNATLSGNSAGGSGGGIAADTPSQATLRNATFAGNSAARPGGAISAAPDASVTLTNTIVSDGPGPNCGGRITSAGHNLDSGTSCGFGATGDLSGADPRLGPLSANGGPTLTHGLPGDSPAIDVGTNGACSIRDQRGVARPRDGNGDGQAVCDIGAYEAEGTLGPSQALQAPSELPSPAAAALPDPSPTASSWLTPAPGQTPGATPAPTSRTTATSSAVAEAPPPATPARTATALPPATPAGAAPAPPPSTAAATLAASAPSRTAPAQVPTNVTVAPPSNAGRGEPSWTLSPDQPPPTGRVGRDRVAGEVVDVRYAEDGISVAIVSRAGRQIVRLACGSECPLIQAGDELDVIGTRRGERLFDAEQGTVRRGPSRPGKG